MASPTSFGPWLVLCALLLAAAAPPAVAEDDFEARRQRAEAALAAESLDEAETLYRRLVDLYPQRVAAYEGLARVLAARGHRDDAVGLLLEVGRELLKLVRAGDALAPAELAVGLSPERGDAHALYGRVLGELRRYGDAAVALERALELGDRDLWTFLTLAASYWETERYGDAEATYRRVLDERGEIFPVLYHFGQFLLWQGRAAEAAPLLDKAATLRPESAGVFDFLARARAESGDAAGAIAAYERVLALEPGHPRARHALELARARHAAGIRPAAGPSEPAPAPAAAGRVLFNDAARDAGLRFRHDPGVTPERHLPETMGAGLAWLDYDGDGWQDLYLVQSGPFPPDGSAGAADRLFRNLGRAAGESLLFEDRTGAAGAGDRCYGQGALAADLDGDGDLDLYLTCFGPDVLLDNRGDGTFADATAARGLGADGWKSSAAAADAEGDGDLDLYVTRYVGYGPQRGRFCGNKESGEPDYCNVNFFAGDDDLLYFQGDGGRFEEVTARAGIASPAGRGLGVVWTDLDGDRRPDLYVANDLDFNRLYKNLGDGTFEDVSLLSGAAFNREGHGEASMGVDAADLDGDGLPELLLAHFDVETNTLYRNLGALQFEDRSVASGFGLPSFNLLGFGLAVADFDGDGHLDAYVANGHVFEHPGRASVTRPQRDLLLLGDGRGHFVEQPLAVEARVGRGAAAADADNDGDPDLAVQNNGGEPFLLRNDTPAGRWLGVELRGRGRNTQAIGARVTLVTGSGRRVRSVHAGRSYQSSADRRLLFAWAGDEEVLALEVDWPSGRTTRILRPPAGRYLRVATPSAGNPGP